MKDELMDDVPPGAIAVPYELGRMQSELFVKSFQHFMWQANPSRYRIHYLKKNCFVDLLNNLISSLPAGKPICRNMFMNGIGDDRLTAMNTHYKKEGAEGRCSTTAAI